MLMTYGLFVFGLSTAAYDELQRQTSWRQSKQSRVGRRPERQYLGVDDETITLSGVLMPQLTGGPSNLDDLREMADNGYAWPLIEGSGYNYGVFVIDSLNETRSELIHDGTAQQIQFTLSLARVDDDRSTRIGQLTDRDVERLVTRTGRSLRWAR